MSEEVNLSQLEDPEWLRLEVPGEPMSSLQFHGVVSLDEYRQWVGEAERLDE